MRIIHCADLHLDSRLSTHLDAEKRKTRRAELLATFLRMVDYAREYEITAIIIAGDLFDTGNISVTAKNAVEQAIRSNPDIGFYYLLGNHDGKGFLEGFSELPGNLFLFGDTWTEYPLGKKVCITGAEPGEQGMGPLLDSLVLDNELINIVVMHGQIAEYKASGKEKSEIIGLRELRGKGIDYLALGHLHGYRLESLDKRGVLCYPGCLEGRGFDECGEHGFVLLEIDEGKNELEPVFIPFAKRKLYTVDADLSGAKNDAEAVSLFRSRLKEQGVSSESLVKLVLKGAVPVDVSFSTELIRSRFCEDYFFVRVVDETTPRVEYDAYRLEASLRGEFVRIVTADPELSEEEKADVIRCGIRALAGEEL